MKIKLKEKTKDLIFIILIIAIAILLVISILQLLKINNNFSTSANPQLNNEINENSIGGIMNCYSKPANEQQKCMDDFIAVYAKTRDTKQMLVDMETARQTDSSIENSCHPIAHAIGRYTFTKYGNVGDAFTVCDQSCHSGCYHGVMERLFYSDKEISETNQHLTYDDLKTKIPGICDEDKFKNPTGALIFQCLHGVGHAILYSLDYDFKGALKTCDLLADGYQRSSCYGGVIMENVTAFDKSKRDLKKEDPHYPCNSIDEKYRSDCYLMQTSVMYEYGLSDQEIANQCRKATPYEGTCFVSLGRDLSNFVRINDKERTRKACEEYSSDYVASCIDGTIYALIDNTWDGRFAYDFCNTLKNPANQRICFRDANNYLKSSYQKTEEDVKNNCSQFAGVNLKLCEDNISYY